MSNNQQPASGVTVESLRELNQCFNRHDVKAVMEYIHPDCVLTMPRGPDPWGTRFEGKAAVREAFSSRLSGLPDARWEDDTHWVGGNHGASQWTLRATAKDGSRIDVQGCDMYRFADGLIIEKHSFWKIVER